MKKEAPYIICHMASTINGKTLSQSWGSATKQYSALYQQCHESFESQAWMCGRVTMEKDFTEGHQPRLGGTDTVFDRQPFIGDKYAASFAIAIDPKGKLGWQENEISGDHIIEVLTEEVSNDYLLYLREHAVSYVFAGKSEIDLREAIQQLTTHFPIQTIMLEGGGHLNGAFLETGLIDEISLLVLPVADTSTNNPTIFENPSTSAKTAAHFTLASVEKLDNDVLWLKYKRQRSAIKF